MHEHGLLKRTSSKHSLLDLPLLERRPGKEVISLASPIQSKQRMLSEDIMSLYFGGSLIEQSFTYNDTD